MKMKSMIIVVALVGCIQSKAVFCQSAYPVRFTIPDSIQTTSGASFTIAACFNTNAPWYIYAPTGNNAAQGMIETTIIYNLPTGFSRKGKMQLPASTFKGGFEVYEGKDIEMRQEFIVAKDLAPGVYTIKVKLSYQACNDKICLPPRTEERELVLESGVAGQESGVVKEDTLKLAFTAMDGRRVDLEEYKGKLVLIDCWASWCRPCIAEFPNLKRLYAQYRQQGFEIIGLSMDDSSAKQRVEDIIAKNKLPWPQGFEGKGFEENSFIKQYGIESLPAVFLIDKKGRLIEKNAGGEGLEQLIKEHL